MRPTTAAAAGLALLLLATTAQAPAVQPADGLVHALDALPAAPNDAYAAEQWNLRAINASWTIEAGSPLVLVAVLDSGILAAHPDLALACAPGCAASPQDNLGHGTHVASILAASTNETLLGPSVGMVGVAPHVKLLSLKVLDDAGTGTWPQLIAGIEAASAAGARVISMSLGGDCNTLYQCDLVQAAINDAHARGSVLVAAAGNSGSVLAPARLDNVTAVGATDANDSVAWFSATGAELDLTAPGVGILGAIPPGSLFDVDECNATDLAAHDGLYCHLSGTSMAAPHVSAAVALLLSHCPALTGDAAMSVLEATVDDLGAPGWDPAYGYGRINVGRALTSPCPP